MRRSLKRPRRTVETARVEMTERSAEQTQWHNSAQTTAHVHACAVQESPASPERPREPSAAERANAPVPVSIAGYDIRRIASSSLYADKGEPYSWFGLEAQ